MNEPEHRLHLALAACGWILLAVAASAKEVAVDFDGAHSVEATSPLQLAAATAAPVPHGSLPIQPVYDEHNPLGDLVDGIFGGIFRGWNWRTVKRIAHDIENAARHVHREAERRAHHGDYDERQALRDLHELERAAAHFHRQVESYHQSPSHTDHDYRRLEDAYEQARHSIRYSHAESHVRADFQRVGRLISELRYYYEDGNHGGDWDHGHGRDHGRGWPGRGHW